MGIRKHKIIGFAGQMMAGKDQSADHLAKRLNDRTAEQEPKNNIDRGSLCDMPEYVEKFRRIAFGDAVKQVYMDCFNVDRDFVEKWKRDDNPPPGFEKNVRESLMFIGDGFRQINPDVWVETLFRELHNRTSKNAVISDMRYYSEARAVRERDGVNVGVWRPGYENSIEHPSEAELKPEIDKLIVAGLSTGPIEGIVSPFDFFLVNDGSLEDLKVRIDTDLVPYLEDMLF